MRSQVRLLAAAWVCAGSLTLWGTRATDAGETAPPANTAALWRQMCIADADSAEFKAAQWKLAAALGTMAPPRRVTVATAMMDGDGESSLNSAALELFGPDALPVTDVQRILWDSQRSAEQRELLKTYYSFCRADAKADALTEPVRRQLAGILAQRLDNLAGTEVHYGEQRLLVHLISAVLSRYAYSADVAEAQALRKALEKYAGKADQSDGLGAAIPTWLELIRHRPEKVETFSQAVQVLGHWDPIVRLKAAAHLGELAAADAKVGEAILPVLGDVRDEVRAAAARVFAFDKDFKPDVVVPQLVTALTQDRGVTVQEAAAEALSVRADQAQNQAGPLLRILTSSARFLGKKRTSHMLTVLGKLVKGATAEEKAQMLQVAQMRLNDSPDGALALLQALGPAAAKAVPAIREYRASADRFRRAYIDRHVLPAILPDEPAGKGE